MPTAKGFQSPARKHLGWWLSILSGVLAICLVAPASGSASTADAGLCDTAAELAAARTGVPLTVLRAITRVETGRGTTRAPWPWAVNHAGNPYWFASSEEAARYVAEQVAKGETNLDLGCFQLNHRWHGAVFASPAQMLDPQENALYAATYLLEKFRITGDWSAAAGAYHSGTAELAKSYAARFDIVQDGLPAPAPLPVKAGMLQNTNTTGRQNTYPLLLAQAPVRGPSLVPRSDAGTPLFGRAP